MILIIEFPKYLCNLNRYISNCCFFVSPRSFECVYPPSANFSVVRLLIDTHPVRKLDCCYMSTGIFSGNPRYRGSWLKEHGLILALGALLIVQSVIFHFTELPDWVGSQQAHGLSTILWPEYWLHYSAEWFVSVLADTYGALLLVLFSKWFFEQGSSENSRQQEKKMKK